MSRPAEVREQKIPATDLAILLNWIRVGVLVGVPVLDRVRGQASLPVRFRVLLQGRVLVSQGQSRGRFLSPEMLPAVLRVQSARD